MRMSVRLRTNQPPIGPSCGFWLADREISTLAWRISR